ncbi:MAG: IclR family transcriptional regulator C-terminal domain-containing protein [Rhizobiaceae bacterium]
MSASEKSTAPGARDIVGSLERGLAVLEILAAHPAGLTLTETAEKAGLTRAGARRLLLTLVATGHASQEARRFLLTARLLSLARTWLSEASLWDYALPFLHEVAEATGESCSAAIIAGTDVVYVARVPGQRIMSVALHVGTRLPAWCTSMGRVLLAGMDEAQRTSVLAQSKIVQNTPKTKTELGAIETAIRQISSQGYAIVDEELETGLISIAVPVCDRAGNAVAAINVPAQAGRYTPDELKAHALPHLQKAAAEIENFFVVQ